MRSKSRKTQPSIDGERFWMAPHQVLNSPAYVNLSHPARTLLIEFGRQLGAHNNGWLIATEGLLIRDRKVFKSSSTLARAKADLVAAGFIHETVKGARPHKASRFAVTWRPLDPAPARKSYEPDALTFKRGGYMKMPLPPAKPSREELYAKWRKQNNPPTPGAVGQGASIPSSGGASPITATSCDGAVNDETNGQATSSEEVHVCSHVLDRCHGEGL